jgi:Icc protein
MRGRCARRPVEDPPLHTPELRRPLRLLQITDTHFCERPGGDILDTGVDADLSLRRVLDDLHYHEHAGADVIVTGDLAQDPVPAAYERLRHALNGYPFSFHCLPGNHDDATLLRAALPGGNVACPKILIRKDWILLLLDSSVPGEPWGRLSDTELALLDATLASHPAPHALVFLHHLPVAVGSPWSDRIALRNADALFATLDRHSTKVRGVVFGHIHQDFEVQRDGVRLIGAPATCIQFAPRTDRLVVDDLPPGCRWLDLHADGRIETGVRFLGDEALRATA